MKKTWELVNRFDVKSDTKNKLFIVLQIVINASIGGLLWLAAGRFVLPGIDWLLCFMGYPAMFLGVIGGMTYLYNHNFS